MFLLAACQYNTAHKVLQKSGGAFAGTAHLPRRQNRFLPPAVFPSAPGTVFSYYKKLIRLRHENEIIVYGDYELLAPEDEALFIYTRMLGTQRLMVLCNFTEKEVAIPQEVTEQIPADAKLLIGNYSKQKEEMLQAYEARVYAYHL